MNYKIQTDKFHRIIFKKYKIRKINTREQTIRNLLCFYQGLCCQSYPSEDVFNLFQQSAYDMRFSVNCSSIGSYSVISYTLKAVDPKYINDSNYTYEFLENAFTTCIEPYIVDGNFDAITFKKVKEIYNSNLLYNLDNEAKKAQTNVISNYFKGTIKDFNPDGSIEELAKITCKRLYNYYKKIEFDEECSYVVGDIDNSYSINLNSTMTPKHNYFFKKRGVCEELIIDNAKTKQAYLEIIYDGKIFPDNKLFYPMTFINYLFGGSSNSKLFSILREKYGLCYSIFSTHMGASGIILVSAIINKHDLSNVLEKIDEVFNILLDEVNLEEIKRYFLLERKGRTDYLETYINDHFMDTYFQDSPLTNQKEELINNVSLADIKKAYKKLRKSFIYVYGGDIDE